MQADSHGKVFVLRAFEPTLKSQGRGPCKKAWAFAARTCGKESRLEDLEVSKSSATTRVVCLGLQWGQPYPCNAQVRVSSHTSFPVWLTTVLGCM